MRWRARFRVAPGAWLTPIVFVVVVAYVARFITFAHREPYALGLTARAMNVLGLVAPVFAAAAAWEGRRLRRSGLMEFPWVRRLPVVIADALWPCVVGSAVVVTGAAVQVLLYEGLLVPDLVVIALALGIVVGLAMVGFGLGVVLPRGLSVAVAAFGAFLWFLIPRVAALPALDHVMGTSLELCCSPSLVLRDGVVSGIVVVIVGLFVATGVALAIVGRPAKVLGAAVIPLAVGLATGAVLAGNAMSPTGERQGAGTDCSASSRVLVCVWPEHRADLPDVLEGVDAAVARWAQFGVRAPGTFLEGRRVGWPEEVTLRLFSRQETAYYTSSAVDAMVGDLPRCQDGLRGASAGAEAYLWVWLARVAGVAGADIAARWEDDMRPDPEEYPGTPPADLVPVLPLVDRVMSLSPERQGEWANANLEALRSCDLAAPIQP